MILVIDAGNTNITLGAFSGDDLVFVSRLATDHTLTEDQFAITMKSIFLLNGCSADDIDGAVIGSVVPEITIELKNAVQKIIGSDPLLIGPGIKTGLDIRVDDPAHLGADLVAGAAAAAGTYKLPCLILDLGTATKISVLDKNGTFCGCIIAPGVGISLSALAQCASQLPQISLSAPSKVIGTNNVDCMRSGIVFGTADMLTGLCARIEKELGMKAESTVVTGGFSQQIAPVIGTQAVFDPNLVLKGLKEIYEKNRPSR